MKKIRERLSYANVVSSLCLFLLLGGGAAFAATRLPKNSVGTAQLRRNAVTGAKIKRGAVSGAKIALGTLGTVPSAAFAARAGSADSATTAATAASAGDARTLQGLGPSGFVRGGGVVSSRRLDLKIGESAPLLQLSGIGTLTASACAAGKTASEGSIGIVNESGRNVTIGLQWPGGADGGTVEPGKKTETGGSEGAYAFTWQLSTDSGPAAIATVDASIVSSGNTGCRFIAQAVSQP